MSTGLAAALVVVLCSVIEGVAQMFFKKSAHAPRRRLAWVGAGVALFILQALLYSGALQFVELSTAFPIGSIGFVVVALLSQRFLGEPVTGVRWLGIALIVAGVALLGAQA